MTIEFPKLNVWQQEAHDEIIKGYNTGKHYIIKSSRQKGKNFLVNVLLIEYCVTYPGSIQILIEPVSSQCRRIHKQISDALANTGLLKAANASTLEIFFRNGSQIIFKSAEQKDSIRGITCSGLCVIDECAYIQDDIIEIILPIVNVKKCPVLLTSTPLFAEGFFYEQWMDTDEDILHFDWNMDKYDMSEYISAKQIEQYRRKYSPQKFLTEIIGDFCADHSFVFGDFKKCIKPPLDTVPVYGGLDFGTGTNDDSTVLTLMNKDRQVVDIWACNNLEPNAQIEALAKYLNDRPTIQGVYCEMNSIGSVYFSVLKDKLNRKEILREFITTNDTKREIIENLIMAFQTESIGIIDDQILQKQLSYYEMQKTKTGYTYNNDNPNHHDDYVMSLAFAYHNYSTITSAYAFGFSSGR